MPTHQDLQQAQCRGAAAVARMEAAMGLTGNLPPNNPDHFAAEFGSPTPTEAAPPAPAPTETTTETMPPAPETTTPALPLPTLTATVHPTITSRTGTEVSGAAPRVANHVVTTDFMGRATSNQGRAGGRTNGRVGGRGASGRGRGSRRSRDGRGRGQSIRPQQIEAFNFDEQELDAHIHDTMQGRISANARKIYQGYLVRIIKFLFDHRDVLPDDLIKQNLMAKLIIANDQDNSRRNSRNEPYKRRHKVDACIKTALTNIRAEDATTHPLDLSKLSFKIVVFFMHKCLSKEITNPRTDAYDHGIEIETTATAMDVDRDDVDADGDTATPSASQKIKIRLKPTSFDGVQSSIACLYTDCDFSRDFNDTTKELWKKLGVYRQGTRRKGAAERSKLGMRTTEGKDPIPLAAYTYLANILHQSDDPVMIACHLFLVLDWNLISRAENVVESNIEIIGLWNDALRFQVGVTKTDQEGVKHVDHPAHVYSCPENPAICPFVALGKYLMCYPHVLKGNCSLFEGSNQYSRFNNILRDIVTSPEHKDAFKRYGLNPQYFGSHSIRKGAATHVSSGTTSCPPIVNICFRANWTLPGVLNRYLKYESAGDLYVGRCVCGRARFGKRFVESLPYFDFSDFGAAEKAVMNKTLDDWIKARMPSGGKDNSGVFGLFKACLASIIYHRAWLESSLHRNSVVRGSIFLSEDIPFAEHVTTRFPWNTTTDTPEITGLPVDAIYLEKIELLQIQIANLKRELLADHERMEQSIINRIEASLDNRSVGGEGYGMAKQIMDRFDQLEKAIASPIVPPRPATHADHADIVIVDKAADEPWDFNLEEEEDIDFTTEFDTEALAVAHDTTIQDKTQAQLRKRKQCGVYVGLHHGKLSTLPSMWQYPTKLSLIQMMTLYLIGNKSEKVLPLKLLKAPDVSHFDEGGQKLARMHRVMKAVKHFGKRRNVWKPRNKSKYWNGETVTKLWDEIWVDLRRHLLTNTDMGDGTNSDHKTRAAEFTYRTCYDKFSKSGLFKELGV